jgi:hypothetical protein
MPAHATNTVTAARFTLLLPVRLRAHGAGAFIKGLWRGLASAVEVYRPQVLAPPQSVEEALRQDWERIGADFRAAMAYEQKTHAAAGR